MSFEGFQAIFTASTFCSTGVEDFRSQNWLRKRTQEVASINPVIETIDLSNCKPEGQIAETVTITYSP